jgi:hypothetical protein
MSTQTPPPKLHFLLYSFILSVIFTNKNKQHLHEIKYLTRGKHFNVLTGKFIVEAHGPLLLIEVSTTSTIRIAVF